MPYSTPEQLRFPPLPGYTVRADFDGGAMSSDFGALLLRGIDRQIGLTERLVQVPLKGGWNHAALATRLSHLAITLATDLVDH
jgi:hypothetical protein